MEKYDVIVLGGGPGGYLAAEHAGHAGLKTLLIEKEHLGGVCLNEGCIPTKALLNSAKIYNHCVKEGTVYGVKCGEAEIDHKKVLAHKKRVVGMLVGGVGMQMKQNHVEVVQAEGRILEKRDGVFRIAAENQEYLGDKLIVATGSSAVVPPIEGVKEGLDQGFVETNREILENPSVPERLTIIGAGVIGLEIASYFNTLGTKVTMIEMLDKIAGPTEDEISRQLQKLYEKKGVSFILGAKVTAVKDGQVCYEKDGEQKAEVCDKVLLSVGRRPNTAGLGLETVGAETERGALMCDEKCRTNVPGLYAVGDVNGKVMLAHTGYREAECAVHDILGSEDGVKYHAIPSVIYTDPEVASVGYTEKTAAEAGYDDVEVVKLPMQYSGRYVAENINGNGFAKVLFDRKSKTMIGAHFLGSYASEFIEVCHTLISLRIPMSEMRRLVFPHPTVCEIIHEAIWNSTIE